VGKSRGEGEGEGGGGEEEKRRSNSSLLYAKKKAVNSSGKKGKKKKEKPGRGTPFAITLPRQGGKKKNRRRARISFFSPLPPTRPPGPKLGEGKREGGGERPALFVFSFFFFFFKTRGGGPGHNRKGRGKKKEKGGSRQILSLSHRKPETRSPPRVGGEKKKKRRGVSR